MGNGHLVLTSVPGKKEAGLESSERSIKELLPIGEDNMRQNGPDAASHDTWP